jgi:hypothetical protein
MPQTFQSKQVGVIPNTLFVQLMKFIQVKFQRSQFNSIRIV